MYPLTMKMCNCWLFFNIQQKLVHSYYHYKYSLLCLILMSKVIQHLTTMEPCFMCIHLVKICNNIHLKVSVLRSWDFWLTLMNKSSTNWLQVCLALLLSKCPVVLEPRQKLHIFTVVPLYKVLLDTKQLSYTPSDNKIRYITKASSSQ